MPTIFFLSLEEVVIIHEKMIDIGGGLSGILDIELLYSAVERPKATFSGQHLYASLFHMGSAMLHSLANNHPFIDGNKRTAFFATLRFFEINGKQFQFTSAEIVSFMVTVITKKLSINEIAIWFEKNQIDN